MKAVFFGLIGLAATWLPPTSAWAQLPSGYTAVGSSQGVSNDPCIRLTSASNGQTGAVWFNKRLRLTDSFTLTFTINLGNNPIGADGLVLVFQTKGPSAIGGPSGGLGYNGLTPSFGVEFDTNQNLEYGDPAEDHIALLRNGLSDHRLNTGFPAPAPILATQPNLRDGRDHTVTVQWDVPTKTLRVGVDCQMRISHSIDLVNSLFNGASEVIWGFTATTGARNNEHRVCFPKPDPTLDTLQACRGEALTLTAPLSPGGQYTWLPATGLDNPQARSPRLTVEKNQLYIVQYTDRCAQRKADSVFVRQKSPTLATDVPASYDCPGRQFLQLDPQATGSGLQYVWWPGGQTQPTLQASTPGTYSVVITTAAGCSATQTFTLLDNCPPETVVVPNAFTPNGDGVNDRLVWQSDAPLNATMKIYNPWGELVFESTESTLHWDGTYRGIPCVPGAYTWTLHYQIQIGVSKQHESFVKRGKVLLLH